VLCAITKPRSTTFQRRNPVSLRHLKLSQPIRQKVAIMFNVNKLTKDAIKSIIEFSEKHGDEVFYGFAIDANLLCLNSEEQFKQTLEKYRNDWGGYSDEEDIQRLRHNTGDWEYQGFSEFSDDEGFDMELYLEHYHNDEEYQESSEYALAMNEVLENLKKSNAFDKLKKTEGFYITRVEHNY